MSLANYKTELAQNVTCEINKLQKGELDCANRMVYIRHGAFIRVYMIECLNTDYETYKEVIDYLYEQVKEMTRYLTISNC